MTRPSFQRSARIVLAVAAKDIAEAIKNRTLLVILFGVLSLMLTGPLLSMLINRSQPVLVMNDTAPSGMIEALQERADLKLVLVSSREEMAGVILQPSQSIIGVIAPQLPADNPGTELVLAGYTAHWVSESRLQQRLAYFEGLLSEATGKTIQISMENRLLYPSKDESYQYSMIAMSFTAMVLLMGLALVPYLFIEEKESHTMDTLRLSPARFWQLVAGKFVAGAVYCLVAALIVMLFNLPVVVHWELMLAVVLLATAFAVSIGLLMGMLFDNTASLGLWTGLLTIILLFSPLIQAIGVGKIPAVIQDSLNWLPSTVIYRLASLTLLGEVQLAEIWPGMLLLIGSTFVILLLVVWRIRRMDQ